MRRKRDRVEANCIAPRSADREEGCIFCVINPDELVEEKELCYARTDRYPVTRGHTLVTVSYTHLTLPTILLV